MNGQLSKEIYLQIKLPLLNSRQGVLLKILMIGSNLNVILILLELIVQGTVNCLKV